MPKNATLKYEKTLHQVGNGFLLDLKEPRQSHLEIYYKLPLPYDELEENKISVDIVICG